MANTEPSKRHNAEPNAPEQDARIVAGPQARTAVNDPAEVEAAWLKWSRGIQPDSARDTTQLREAFEAGWNARG
jgi:hypothetical protein